MLAKDIAELEFKCQLLHSWHTENHGITCRFSLVVSPPLGRADWILYRGWEGSSARILPYSGVLI